MQWFRLYAEFAFDPKIQSMSETFQRRYIMLLCVTCNGDVKKITDEELACAMRISVDDLQKTKEVFINKGLITDGWMPRTWAQRQYLSDVSTPRVKKHREKKRNVSETLQKRKRNGNVTPPDTDTDTDTDTDQPSISPFDEFWKTYPNKKAKGNAEKAWKKINPDQELARRILMAVIRATHSEDWTKEGGKFIPHPATWLNGKRWEDEYAPQTKQMPRGFASLMEDDVIDI
jgi:hypothetical protein